MSQKQLKKLRKISSKHLKAPSIANKEDDGDNVATVDASTSSSESTIETGSTETTTEPVTTEEESLLPTSLSASTIETVSTQTIAVVKEPVTREEESLLPTSSRASTTETIAVLKEPVTREDESLLPTSSRASTETVSTETTTVLKEPVTRAEESPIRHRLTNLLDGSSLSPYEDSAAHSNEENGKSFNCKGGGRLNNAESVSGPVSTEENMFCSSELLSSDNGLSPLMHEEDCITVPCYPDVVAKTCMQVETGCTQTSSDNDSQAADVITASVQDKEEDHETNERLQPSCAEEMPSVPEEGNEPGSVSPSSSDVLGQLSNNTEADDKEAENENAEEDSGVMSRSAEVRAEDRTIDYSSHYNTLEVCGTSLPLTQCGVHVNGILYFFEVSYFCPVAYLHYFCIAGYNIGYEYLADKVHRRKKSQDRTRRTGFTSRKEK